MGILRAVFKWRRPILALALTSAAWMILAFQTAAIRDYHLARIPSPRRFWDDTTIAIGRYLDWRYGPANATEPPESLDEAIATYGFFLRRGVNLHDIENWQFWRAIPPERFQKHRRAIFIPQEEDPGRAMLLTLGYKALGGVAPFLLFWLGALCALPVLAWLAIELFAARRAIMAAILLVLASCSAWFIEALSLPHSAVGFYLIAIAALMALAVYAAAHPRPSRAGLLVRTLIAALVFALCALCRSDSVLLLPGFLLALFWGVKRLHHDESAPARQRAWSFLLATAVLIAPYLAVRPAEQHDVWKAIWEGLGDFDRTYDFYWSDYIASDALVAAGGRPFTSPKDTDPSSEAIFRRLVLSRIQSDPGWYAVIIGQRSLATLAQAKLAPWGPRDGTPITLPRFQHRYTRTIDLLAWGTQDIELPLSCILLPGIVMGMLWIATRRKLCGWVAFERVDAIGRVMMCVACATLPVPILISTVSGVEAQAFACVYAIAFAFLAGEGARLLLTRVGRARPDSPARDANREEAA
ncbi:MAG: hypothetical protein MUF51_06020 [Vicinamibacteria bacterium]|jgi:hypothetical protein|nr:hypothetical protein [Vicinamibacteria bacterium]